LRQVLSSLNQVTASSANVVVKGHYQQRGSLLHFNFLTDELL